MFKIMLATDNHIGYLERDPIRGQDSINTFEEILQLAVKHDVRICIASRAFLSSNHATQLGRFHIACRRSIS